jgi:formamidopyrimidine-DNA glycosylase
MPELPEVEVTRRSVADGLEGARVRRVELGLPLRWPLGIAPAALEGAVAGAMTRRGKYLWLPLAAAQPQANGRPDEAVEPTGPGPGGLLIHLGMSGALSFGPVPDPPGPYDHFRLVTDRGCLWLTDPRRFGAVVWSASSDVDPARKLLAGLGPEPFDPALDAARFHAALKARRAPVKTALLSGELVVGAGNIYACEALWHARIDPRTPACRISAPRAARLLEAIRQVLGRAIEAGGSTLRDFNANGVAGHYQNEAHVYGRAGEACHSCGGKVRRIVQGQRATYFCGHCQKR